MIEFKERDPNVIDFELKEVENAMARDEGKLIEAKSVSDCLFEVSYALGRYSTLLENTEDERRRALYGFAMEVLTTLGYRIAGTESPIQKAVKEHQNGK